LCVRVARQKAVSIAPTTEPDEAEDRDSRPGWTKISTDHEIRGQCEGDRRLRVERTAPLMRVLPAREILLDLPRVSWINAPPLSNASFVAAAFMMAPSL